MSRSFFFLLSSCSVSSFTDGPSTISSIISMSESSDSRCPHHLHPPASPWFPLLRRPQFCAITIRASLNLIGHVFSPTLVYHSGTVGRGYARPALSPPFWSHGSKPRRGCVRTAVARTVQRVHRTGRRDRRASRPKMKKIMIVSLIRLY